MPGTSGLAGKRIVLGVSGGIAAYKSVELLRRLMDLGAYVSPILSDAALRFVGATTFSALASEPVQTSVFDALDPIPHTRLGQQADLIVVAPATADLIARYAAGLANDLLTTTLIATKAPVVLVAAMHSEMWQHPSVVDNILVLRSRGVFVLEPEIGRLAGGDVGVGRLATTDVIVNAIESVLIGEKPLTGKRVLVTAGGTREAIDPVRYIGNRSSGKQGVAFANVAASLGGQVTLITTVEAPVDAKVEVYRVESAQEMFESVLQYYNDCDLMVMAAAVADFRPVDISRAKIKKSLGVPRIVLEPTPDILATLGAKKRGEQILIGFAAETDEVHSEAMRKLQDKNADFIVANNVLEPGAGFSTDTNRVTLVGRDFVEEFEIASKLDVASKVLRTAMEWAKANGIWK